jgi:transposase
MSLPNHNNDDPTSSPGRTRQTNQGDISPEERQRILDLHSHRYGMRQIALRIGRDRKTVRRILQDEGLLDRQPPDQTGKLDPFRETIQEKVRKRLTATRILREIRQQGYAGGRTILTDYIRSIRSELVPRPRVKRRFETRPGQEMQADWTVYTVPIAGSPTRVHALVCELAYSRKAHVHFYRNEREPTLLEGLALAFESFTGVTQRVVFDSMSTIVLGRIGSNGKPIWHPRFLDFAKYYGFEPFLCKVRDPDRKGKTEKFIRFLEDDCIRGAEFASFDELNGRVHDWIDNIANRRTHGTTGLVPDEVWLSERDFLIRLPETRFAVHEDAVRQVGPDATVWIQGTPYTVPAQLANRSAAVRLYAEHFEVMNRSGQIAFSRRYVEAGDKGRLQIDPAHYATLPGRHPGPAGTRIDDLFLKRFPQLAGLVEGIAKRMKSLAPIHLRALWRLADLYGEPAFLSAAARVLDFRRFNAEAVRRILERDYPLPEPPPVTPMSPAARTLALLSEVEPGSLDSFAHLDQAEASVPSAPEAPVPTATPANPTPGAEGADPPANPETKNDSAEDDHDS